MRKLQYSSGLSDHKLPDKEHTSTALVVLMPITADHSLPELYRKGSADQNRCVSVTRYTYCKIPNMSGCCYTHTHTRTQ